MPVNDKNIERIEARLTEHDRAIAGLQRDIAVRNERDIHIDNQLTTIKSEVKGINDNFKWAARAFFGSMIVAFMTWVYSGGLSGGQ